MIQQVLDRTFVLARLGEVRNHMERVVSSGERRGEETGLQNLTRAEQMDVLNEIRAAQTDEAAQSTGQIGFDMPASRRGGSSRSIDEVSFLSRSPVISNLQSAIEQHYEEKRQGAVKTSRPAGRRGGGSITPVTNRRLLGAFEPTDIKWISALTAMGLRLYRGKYQFNERPSTNEPLKIANNARILLVGDWGSGVPRAQEVAKRMREELDKGNSMGLQQHVIHLGDVYYSGWDREYRKRFLDYWPVREDEATTISSWTLNGNHDMYSGGHGYYTVALTDPRFKLWHNSSSFFALENDHWRILGLDTAYDDFDLRSPQPRWVKENMDQAASRKIMLLSHHQLFSAYESGGPKLKTKLGPVLVNKGITSWFWGHEHRCVLYKEGCEGVKFGRCIGHGGVPVYMNHKPSDPIPDPGVYEFRDYVAANPLEHWALFGFAVLDFHNDTISVRYIDERGGNPYKEEKIR
jgi:hypothetical protein